MKNYNGKEIDAIIGYASTTYMDLSTLKETLHAINMPKIYAGYAQPDIEHDELYNHIQV